ncbi:MAG TPA: undecaprenyl-phosphate alpha-N-acetylglucosaminyl 1-phosphate transferase, partial [Firmicutes bacterium]|nr:undecaprenyl-phosphate alpha-N-acetylglucosaminyl 1-phosphate transferase [Bacillota bacterium]
MKYLLIISTCFLLATFLTPSVMKLAFFTNAIDKPNQRKVHKVAIPRLGGLAIYIAFLLGYMIFGIKNYAINEQVISFIDAYFIASFVIIVTGMLDDMFDLPPKSKGFAQLIAALIMVLYGNFVINKIYLPFLPVIDLGILGSLVTILWIVGITNSINFIDGLDGLSSGLSAITLGTMAVLASFQGELFVVLMCCLLLGSTLGFLVHNFYPAKIFMGDTGSLFLGFSISVISLLGYKNAAFVSFIVPIIILSVPLFDTLWAIVRRLLKKQSPFRPDRGHIHHRLLDRNLGHVRSVLTLYSIATMFSFTA